jgi:hypothetical protein
MKIILICLTMLFIGACSSATLITSSDPEARIYVNDEYIGVGKATYTDKKVAFSNNSITIKKPGCEPNHHSFRRNEKADGGAIIGGILVVIPFLWVTEYKKEHNYEYDCVQVGQDSSAES